MNILFQSVFPNWTQFDINGLKLQSILYEAFDTWDIDIKWSGIFYVHLTDFFSEEFCYACTMKDIPYITVSKTDSSYVNWGVYSQAVDNKYYKDNIEELLNEIKPVTILLIGDSEEMENKTISTKYESRLVFDIKMMKFMR